MRFESMSAMAGLLLAGSVTAQSLQPGSEAPTPADPYPATAAGWGPDAGNGLFSSRWAEDWRGMRAAGKAPSLKALALGGDATLTLNAEVRLRHDVFDNAQMVPSNDYQQDLLRGVFGAKLRFNPSVSVFAELGTGQVDSHRGDAAANFQNNLSLQQLFVDLRRQEGAWLFGAMAGRQEFADGPRQLLSLSDGPNLHRTWNGVRLYLHGSDVRVGAFDLRVTRPGREYFDETINNGETLQGIDGGVVLASGRAGITAYLDPFWLRSENRAFATGGRTGLDERDTVGARLSGQYAAVRFDWTMARQSGHNLGRDVDAWGFFALNSVALPSLPLSPRLTLRVDIASGGGAYGTGTLKGFNQLYASSSYLGEGRLLSLSNLRMFSPGLSLAPTARTTMTFEYGITRRMAEDDAAYAGVMKAYAGTQRVSGHDIGGFFRANGTWSLNRNMTLSFNFEHLAAGEVLTKAGFRSGSYSYVGATYRY